MNEDDFTPGGVEKTSSGLGKLQVIVNHDVERLQARIL
jgi:hypothetical protein